MHVYSTDPQKWGKTSEHLTRWKTWKCHWFIYNMLICMTFMTRNMSSFHTSFPSVVQLQKHRIQISFVGLKVIRKLTNSFPVARCSICYFKSWKLANEYDWGGTPLFGPIIKPNTKQNSQKHSFSSFSVFLCHLCRFGPFVTKTINSCFYLQTFYAPHVVQDLICKVSSCCPTSWNESNICLWHRAHSTKPKHRAEMMKHNMWFSAVFVERSHTSHSFLTVRTGSASSCNCCDLEICPGLRPWVTVAGRLCRNETLSFQSLLNFFAINGHLGHL